WEFLMLFLAVFCGFLAENIREHLIEKTREKQYIRSVLDDLRNGSLILANSMTPMKQTMAGLDSLIEQTYLVLSGKGDTRKMYYAYHHDCRKIYDLEFSESSIIQLQNSGNI